MTGHTPWREVKADTWKCWRDPSHKTRRHPTLGWPQCLICAAAPAYYERPSYLPNDFVLEVYVPAPSDKHFFWAVPGSGIVGLNDRGAGRTTIYYEGWIHGAMQYSHLGARGRWAAGVENAASRLVTAYPTSAMASVPTDELHVVGLYQPLALQLTICDETALEGWLA